MISDDELNQALDRIARTADGELFYRYLQKGLMGSLDEHAPSESALRTEHGRRRFAAELMAKMAKGIDESGGHTNTSRTERTVVFRARESAVRATPRRFREWAADNDPELHAFTVNNSGVPGDAA
jgi:hypothetical protein